MISLNKETLGTEMRFASIARNLFEASRMWNDKESIKDKNKGKNKGQNKGQNKNKNKTRYISFRQNEFSNSRIARSVLHY